MRVNARLDMEAAAQVDYLIVATGAGVSHVLRESVAHHSPITSATPHPLHRRARLQGLSLEAGEALRESFGRLRRTG